MNIPHLDLNLLQTFHAVHATRNVSRAAERLGLSQPTVSHALRRLRELYKDPLFVRTQGGMAPTAKADSLAKAVQHALHILDVAIHETEHYDPARSERIFRLYMTDIGETVFLPPLTQALAKIAPRIRLDIFQLDEKDIQPALETGRIDMALGYLPVLADAVEKQFLLHEKYVVLMRAGHPLAHLKPSAAALKRLSYVLVRSHSATARALAELGLEDNVRLAIPHFMVLPRIVAETDLAVIMPARLSEAFVSRRWASTRFGRTMWACPRSTFPYIGTGGSKASQAIAGCASLSARCSARVKRNQRTGARTNRAWRDQAPRAARVAPLPSSAKRPLF